MILKLFSAQLHSQGHHIWRVTYRRFSQSEPQRWSSSGLLILTRYHYSTMGCVFSTSLELILFCFTQKPSPILYSPTCKWRVEQCPGEGEETWEKRRQNFLEKKVYAVLLKRFIGEKKNCTKWCLNKCCRCFQGRLARYLDRACCCGGGKDGDEIPRKVMITKQGKYKVDVKEALAEKASNVGRW